MCFFCKDSLTAKVHGDFWLGNIILSGNKIYLTDWEYSREAEILYDLFNFIIIDFYKKKELWKIDKVIQGYSHFHYYFPAWFFKCVCAVEENY